jgi:P-type Cu2+ transporter
MDNTHKHFFTKEQTMSHNHGHRDDKGSNKMGHGGHGSHAHMMEDFKKRFWISFALTIPVLLLSQTIKKFLHLEQELSFKEKRCQVWTL